MCLSSFFINALVPSLIVSKNKECIGGGSLWTKTTFWQLEDYSGVPRTISLLRWDELAPSNWNAASTWAHDLTNFTRVSFHHRAMLPPLCFLSFRCTWSWRRASKRAAHTDPALPLPAGVVVFYFFSFSFSTSRSQNKGQKWNLLPPLCASHRGGCLFKPIKCCNHLTKLRLSFAHLLMTAALSTTFLWGERKAKVAV